jgi:hypothetical protein
MPLPMGDLFHLIWEDDIDGGAQLNVRAALGLKHSRGCHPDEWVALLSVRQVSMLVMFFNTAKAEGLVLLRHFNKMPQALFEFLGTISRPIDEGDANAFVGV